MVVKVKPFIYHIKYTTRQFSFNFTGLNVNHSSIIIIANMEMRRIMIAIIHSYDNTIKAANLWHTLFIFNNLCNFAAKLVFYFEIDKFWRTFVLN